jgi:phage terminase small subunit
MKKKYLIKIKPIQEKFIDEYCSKFGEISATQCAINAGYARGSAHTRAHELLDWRQHPDVRQEIDRRLEDTRKVWEIDRDKHLRKLNDIGKKADAKGLYGVSLKAEELRGKVAGLYVEKQMVMKAELTGDEINAKWKSLFKSREEAELANITLMDEVWGIENQVIADTKQLQKEADDARIEKELHKYQELRGNIKKK